MHNRSYLRTTSDKFVAVVVDRTGVVLSVFVFLTPDPDGRVVWVVSVFGVGVI